jgi:hypothetical protein
VATAVSVFALHDRSKLTLVAQAQLDVKSWAPNHEKFCALPPPTGKNITGDELRFLEDSAPHAPNKTLYHELSAAAVDLARIEQNPVSVKWWTSSSASSFSDPATVGFIALSTVFAKSNSLFIQAFSKC